MKRLFTSVMMVVYMASAIGLTFSLHYCGKHFMYITFSEDTEKGCCDKNEHKTKCCTDKVVKAKIKDIHSTQGKAVEVKVLHTAVPMAAFGFTAIERKTHAVNRSFPACNSSPPFVSSVPIYIANRVFRI